MEKLRLPVIKEQLPQSRALTMDEYLRFVMMHIRYTFDKKAYQRSKKLSAVNVRFVLKD